MSPGVSVTVSGTVVPASPCVSTAAGGGPVGPRTSSALFDNAGPSGPPKVSVCAAKSMRTAPKRLSTSDPSRPTGCPGTPKSGRVAAVSVCGLRATPATDHDVTPTGCAFPVQPTPANSVDDPACDRCNVAARRASMMDSPAPESITNGYGPRPSMQTLTISATWPATVLTVIGMRWRPAQRGGPAAAGRRRGEGEVHQRFDVDMAEPRAPTSRVAAVMSAASEAATRCNGLGPRDGQAHGGQDQAHPRTAAARGSAARRHPDVVRTVKRSAERWWATIMR
jgi:hypothetical protein